MKQEQQESYLEEKKDPFCSLTMVWKLQQPQIYFCYSVYINGIYGAVILLLDCPHIKRCLFFFGCFFHLCVQQWE